MALRRPPEADRMFMADLEPSMAVGGPPDIADLYLLLRIYLLLYGHVPKETNIQHRKRAYNLALLTTCALTSRIRISLIAYESSLAGKIFTFYSCSSRVDVPTDHPMC